MQSSYQLRMLHVHVLYVDRTSMSVDLTMFISSGILAYTYVTSTKSGDDSHLSTKIQRVVRNMHVLVRASKSYCSTLIAPHVHMDDIILPM